MVEDKDLKPGQPRLLATDTEVVVPINKIVKVLITSNDVLHAWAIPAFGIKMDTVPGRINEAWIRVPAEKAGVYRGQCSELCGVNHGYMPIVIDAMPKQKFAKWLERAKKEFASNVGQVDLAQTKITIDTMVD